MSEFTGDDVQHANGFAADFRADPVTGQECDFEIHEYTFINQWASKSPYSTESTSASKLASIIFALAPTVLQRWVPFCVSISTRVTALVPFSESRMRTL